MVFFKINLAECITNIFDAYNLLKNNKETSQNMALCDFLFFHAKWLFVHTVEAAIPSSLLYIGTTGDRMGGRWESGRKRGGGMFHTAGFVIARRSSPSPKPHPLLSCPRRPSARDDEGRGWGRGGEEGERGKGGGSTGCRSSFCRVFSCVCSLPSDHLSFVLTPDGGCKHRRYQNSGLIEDQKRCLLCKLKRLRTSSLKIAFICCLCICFNL